jgi:hypothetical protein
MSSIIGGEFGIDPCSIDRSSIFQFEANEYIYASGRGALYSILMNIKINYPEIKKILLPNYLCYSIVETVNKANFDFIFYNIDWTFCLITDRL